MSERESLVAARYVKGERRKLVEAVRDAANQVLVAENYAKAYVAFVELGHAVTALDAQIAAMAGRKA